MLLSDGKEFYTFGHTLIILPEDLDYVPKG